MSEKTNRDFEVGEKVIYLRRIRQNGVDFEIRSPAVVVERMERGVKIEVDDATDARGPRRTCVSPNSLEHCGAELP